MLAKYGRADRVEELNRIGSEHARSQSPEGGFVLGSIGPTCEFLQPDGAITEQAMYDAFTEQARGLAAGGVDGFCVETIIDFGETALAARETTGLPAMATMTFDKGPRGYFAMMGLTPSAAADVVGSNCGIATEQMIEIIAAMRGATDKPIATHINAGILRIEGGKIVYPDTLDHMPL